MGQINWDQFKEYKQSRELPKDMDNFQVLLDFVHSFYNKRSPFEVFDFLVDDELARMMMEKRHIREAEDLEAYVYKGKLP